MIKKMALFTLLSSYAVASEYVLEFERESQVVEYTFIEEGLIVKTSTERRTENSSSVNRSSTTYKLQPKFDPQAYMGLYSDVRDNVQSHFPDDPFKQQVAAAFHYIKIGKKENRQYS